MKSFLFAAYILGAGFACAGSAYADTPGIDDKTILLGQSAAFSGAAAPLGESVYNGAMLYFDEVNRNGGVHGRRISLLALDDGYGAENTVANTKLFVEDDGIFALFGYVGTQTSNAVLPIVAKAEIPFFGAFVGPQGLNSPSKYVLNLRTEYSNDAYGDAVSAEPSYRNLPGYIAAKTFVEVLWRTGPDLTREKFVETLQSFRDVDLGDFRVTYTPNDHGSGYVGLTVTIDNEDDAVPAMPAQAAWR